MTLSSDQAVVINDNTSGDITPADVRTALGYINSALNDDGTAGAAYGRALLGIANQAALTALIGAATAIATGAVELATSAETITGTDTVRAVTPAGAAAAYQPLDSDLTAIAALTTTSFGRSLLAAADATAARVLDVSAAEAPGYVTGDWHSHRWLSTNTRTVAQGNLWLMPIQVRSAVTFDRIQVEITTVGTGSSVVRLGIWNHNASTGKPGTLLLDCGTVSGLALATVAATISQALNPGWYWLGCAGQTVTGAMAVRGFSNALDYLFPQSSVATGTIATNSFLVTGQTGAFGTMVGASFGIGNATAPIVQVRVA